MMNRFNKMEHDIREIKQLIESKLNESHPQAPAQNRPTTYAGKAATIVIKPNDEVENDQPVTQDNLDEIRNIAIDKSVEVLSTYKNKQGNHVIICKNEKSKETLMPHLAQTFPTKTLHTPPPRCPTITIKGIHGEYDSDTLYNTVKRQNPTIDVTPENFNVIFTKEVYGKPGISYAVVRVADKVRDQLKTNRDALCIGMQSCKIWDRFFARRCNKCQELGHFHGQCEAERPVCAKCTGAHETRTCDVTRYKCHNCALEGRNNTGHPAYSPKCPVYIAAQNKVKEKISYYQKN